MATKAHPERVDGVLARRAAKRTYDRNALYSHYIVETFRATGQLAPGCDARDLLVWYEQNYPQAFLPFDQRPSDDEDMDEEEEGEGA